MHSCTLAPIVIRNYEQASSEEELIDAQETQEDVPDYEKTPKTQDDYEKSQVHAIYDLITYQALLARTTIALLLL